MTMSPIPSNPKALAEKGEEIYARRYKERYEREQIGKFVAIDVVTEKAYVESFPEEALFAAKKDNPHGLFHLIRIGFPAALSTTQIRHHGSLDWLSA
jgi:hypothetical protein